MSLSPAGKFKLSRILIVIGVVGALLIWKLDHRDGVIEKRVSGVFGTDMRIVVVRGGGVSDVEDTLLEAVKQAKHLSRMMNVYDSSSEISRLNRNASGKAVKVSPELFGVLMEAMRFHRLTGGAFDVTVYPLSKLYKKVIKSAMLNNHKTETFPTGEEVYLARKKVGSRYLAFNSPAKEISFMREGMECDLGGIAKGYAVDRIIDILKAGGIKNACVEIGGEVRVLGTSVDKGAWKIKVRHPDKAPEGGEYLREIELSDSEAVATSGNYLQYFEHNGKRYSHIIDPRTGKPADPVIAGVSVVSKNCVFADALATSISVLGVQKAKEILAFFPETVAVVQLRDFDGNIEVINIRSE
jgi:thiamine biosynthesis lipoprotein